jgi:hypothetical protein
MNLLTTSNYKTLKGERMGVMTGILHLAPYNLSGMNVCPMASQGCASSCLNTAGRGAFSTTQQARIRRTKMFFEEREMFIALLRKDIETLRKKAQAKGMIAAVRLNGTSDIDWRRFGIFEAYPDVQFYDYTKVYRRMVEPRPSNYHLTFSRSECNESDAIKVLGSRGNVAVVFKELPDFWNGYKVIFGDESDVRFEDEQGVVIGLLAKGKARKDNSGFVVTI